NHLLREPASVPERSYPRAKMLPELIRPIYARRWSGARARGARHELDRAGVAERLALCTLRRPIAKPLHALTQELVPWPRAELRSPANQWLWNDSLSSDLREGPRP